MRIKSGGGDILLRNFEIRRPLRRSRRRWEDNIKMDSREVGCDAGDWIDLRIERENSILGRDLNPGL